MLLLPSHGARIQGMTTKGSWTVRQQICKHREMLIELLAEKWEKWTGQKSDGKVMAKYGKTMAKTWENMGKSMKSWEKHMGKP